MAEDDVDEVDEREMFVRLSRSWGKYYWEIMNEEAGHIVTEGGAVDKGTAHRLLQEAIERLCADW